MSSSLLQPNNDTNVNAPTIGTAILKSRGLFVDGYWYWISIGALVVFALLFNMLFILSLTFLNRKLLVHITNLIFHFHMS